MTLTSGLNEELYKFLLVSTRLRISLEQVVKSCCLSRCLRSSKTPGFACCAWWMKLVRSPMAVVLCGMASGAGFGALENADRMMKVEQYSLGCWKALPEYFCSDTHLWGLSIKWAPFVLTAINAILHTCWTGTVAVALACEWFLSPCLWPLKYVALAMVIVLHGTFEASIHDEWLVGHIQGFVFEWPVFITIVTIAQFACLWCFALFYMEPKYEQQRQKRIDNADESDCIELT